MIEISFERPRPRAQLPRNGARREPFLCTGANFSTLSFSTKNIRRQLHGDAELTIACLALEGLIFEIEEKPDGVSDRICALGLKEDSRCADIACDADPMVQLERKCWLKALSSPFSSI